MTEADQVEPEEVEPTITHIDKILKLDSREVILGRVIIDNSSERPDYINVFRPVEIHKDAQGTHLRPWIPESVDEYYPIPSFKVIALCTPHPKFLSAYKDSFMKLPQKTIDPETGAEIKIKH